jgi:predicted AlkP superfamily phosphohydrolase/phosphomutase
MPERHNGTRPSTGPGPPGPVFGIGLDGATFDLLIPWFNEGKLPTLRRLYEQGAHATLESTIPYLSPQAWTSFMTGKNPGKHGVWDFIQHVPGTYDLQFANGSLRRAPTLWRLLSDAGLRVGVMNVPMTFPPERVNGFLLSGMEAPGVYANFAYPPEIYPSLKKALGGYNMHGDYWIAGTPDEYLANVHKTVSDQSRAARFLLNEHPCDFFFLVYGSTDRVQHHFWAYMDRTHPLHDPAEAERYGEAIYRVYEQIDGEIAGFLSELPAQTTVFVMSDHGAGPYQKIVYLDRWLAAQGLLSYHGAQHSYGRLDPRRALFTMTKEIYMQFRRQLGQGVRDWLKGMFPATRRRIESYLMTSGIDWRRTAAFSLGIESTRIFINKTGRFPHGWIRPGAEYEKVMRTITEGLSALRDPETGEPVVARIYRPEELYSGPLLHEAADLIVTWRDDLYITRKGYGPEIDADPHRFIDDNIRTGIVGELMAVPQTGTHRRDGVFMLTGPLIRSGQDLGRASILDLMPTLLHLMGLPVPGDVDGQVLTEALAPARQAPDEVQYSAIHTAPPDTPPVVHSMEADTSVEERLRRLGYIE